MTERIRSSAVAITLLALLVAIALTVPAQSQDSDAPKGANPRWLPCEAWVMFHWLPFDENSLFRLGGFSRSELKAHLKTDGPTIAQLLRKKGRKPDVVVAKLMYRWRGKVDDRRLKELTRRANALMTQSHLSQHVFFHLYHHPAIGLNSRYIFKLPTADYHKARMSGFSPREIAKYGGVSVKTAVRRTMAVFKKSQAEGVRRHNTTRAEARTFLKHQRAWTRNWLAQDIHLLPKREFPHGTKPFRGSRMAKACRLMTGADHEQGEHDDALRMSFLYCDLATSKGPAALSR